MTDRIETEALAQLLAQATPGPWAFEAHGDTGDYGVGLCFSADDENCDHPISGEVLGDTIVQDPVAVEVKSQANARLISLTPGLAAEVLEHREAAARAKQAPSIRPTFPILGSNGARIDLQLVVDHGEQVKRNHYQTVDRLAARGGLSWPELHAVLHNCAFKRMDQNEAMLACRQLEARYLISATPAPVEGNALSNAARDVVAERRRQIAVEGWSANRDDAYQAGDLGNAAACYAMTDPVMDPDRPTPVDWPWAASWWKPTDRRRDLVKAGALILAEIERLDRATAHKGEA